MAYFIANVNFTALVANWLPIEIGLPVVRD